MSAKTACVIGAGASGIAALKECVKYGFKPTCYELDSDIGGIWHKKDYTQSTNTPAVWEGLITNTSKFNTCYSDFPPQSSDTPYLTAEAMFTYFKRAVDHFGLEQYIQFDTRVIKVRKTTNHATTGQWEVFTTRTRDEISGGNIAGPRGDDDALVRCHREVFDVVLVCTGYFKVPFYPDVPGLDTFQGTVQHSFSYAHPKPYEGKHVLIVGNGLSALDVASSISNHAHKIYLALGEGTWIIPRSFSNARQLDQLFPRSVLHSRDAIVQINNRFIQEADSRIDHTSAGIRPAKPPVFAPFGLSDVIPFKMLAGQVQAYGHLIRIEADQAYFKDSKVISGIDAIIFCTGYKPDLSFLDLDVLEANGKMELYKMIFPLNENHNTLALIGHVAGDGPAAILYETQARLAVRVMVGRHILPPRDKMKHDMQIWNDHTYARKGHYKSYFVSVSLLTDLIAKELGCYPTFWKVFIRDPRLALRNWYGPLFAAQYRLVGPDSMWEEAVKTCYTLYDERHSSIRHVELKDLHRDDIYACYKDRAALLIAFSAMAVLTGFLCRKYQDKIFQLL